MLLVVLVLIFIMSATGLLMKYSSITTEHLPFINLDTIRYLHNTLSLYFALVLSVMALTGLYMYLFPALQQRALAKKRKITQPTPTKTADNQGFDNNINLRN